MSIAWLFPGQGSQSVGMAKDILDASEAARAVFKRADAALGEPLTRLILEGPAADLTLTANAQPAIVTTSCAILAAIRERIPQLMLPDFGAGHSLGEYSALVAAEALTFEDAVRLVRARGKAMQEAVPPGTGAMAAIMGMMPDRLEELCEEAAAGEVVAPANFNTPGQIVVAGHATAVARLAKLVAEAGGRTIPLNVSAPFHCALMAPAAEALRASLSTITVSSLRFPVVANFDGTPNRDKNRVKELLIRQVDGPVRWEDCVRTMLDQGVTHAIEIGPGKKILANFAKRISTLPPALGVATPASQPPAMRDAQPASLNIPIAAALDMKVLTVNDLASLDQVGEFLESAGS